MKTPVLLLGILLTSPLASHAQRATTPNPVSSFFTPGFQASTSADTTALCAETIYRDSLSGVTRMYYPSGHLKQYIPFAHVARGIRHGCVTTWYEDGQLCTKEDYMRGQRNGELLTYYPDGTLKRRERYEEGRCGVGTCYDSNGYPIQYFSYEQLPLYPGGAEQLMKELTRAVRLNAQETEAMRRESRGMQYNVKTVWKRQVDVELTVTADGRVANARVVHSNAGFLNNAALRAAATLKRQFVPGRRDGQVLMSFLTVPLYYTMELPNRNYNNNSIYNRGYGDQRRW
jgi:protein TonB